MNTPNIVNKWVQILIRTLAIVTEDSQGFYQSFQAKEKLKEKKQERKYTCNVTLWRVNETIFAVVKQQVFCIFTCVRT